MPAPGIPAGGYTRRTDPHRRRLEALALAGIVLVAAVLLVPRLDDRFLWQDEAETALLARNVLRFGVPIAWDGRDLVSQECGEDLDRNALWRQSPWLPIYAVAESFRLLGTTVLAARLPFVLFALLTLPSVWLLGRRLFADARVAPLATAALALSVPFLVYARQARYYSLVALVATWTLLAFVAAARGSRGAAVGLVVAVTALLHANFLIAGAVIVGLGTSLAVLRPSRAALAGLAAAAVATAALNAPWLLVFDVSGKSALTAAMATPGAFASRLGASLRALELYVCPAGLLAAALAITLLRAPRRAARATADARMAAALAAFAGGYVLALAATPAFFERYLVGLFPAAALVTGYTLARVSRANRTAAAVLFLLVVGVDRADLLRLVPAAPLAKYVDEITHDYQGPIEAVARFLAREAAPGDRVFVTYGELALRFHAGIDATGEPRLDVRGGTGCEPLEGRPEPEWLVVRAFFRLNPLALAGREDAERVRRWVNALLGSGHYRRIELDAVDVVHDALPEPGLHLYRAPRDGPRVAVWRRVGSPARLWHSGAR